MARFPALVALVIVAAACGDSASTTTAPTTSTSSSTSSAVTATTVAIPTPFVAMASPPASYAEVEQEFAELTDEVRALGRSARQQFMSEEFEALYARFGEEMTAQVSLEELSVAKTEIESQAPLGEFGLERAIHLGPELRAYGAELEWGDEALTFNAIFDGEDVITGLFLNSVLPQPPDPAAGFESEASFRLPFDGLWFTFWGGDTAIENYHVDAAVQRHAFDFVVWRDGGTHTGDGSQVTDYWAYGQQVLAPAAGTVVTVVDGLPDQIPQTGGDPINPAGNHVVIEVAPGEHLLIAHIQAGTFEVTQGDEVAMGQQLALVGNSGSTTEPHIHIHLQREPRFSITGSGLPLVFDDYLANGETVERDQPLGDQFVRNG